MVLFLYGILYPSGRIKISGTFVWKKKIVKGWFHMTTSFIMEMFSRND